MKRILPFLAVAGLLLGAGAAAAEPGRQQLSMDQGWKFQLGDVKDGQSPVFDDSKWRILDVPHDWSIESAYDQSNPTGKGGGYLAAGVGWYRKEFTLPVDDATRRVFIEFDGVMANSDVWINGTHLGKRPFGYISFRYELTALICASATRRHQHVLAVRVDNTAAACVSLVQRRGHLPTRSPARRRSDPYRPVGDFRHYTQGRGRSCRRSLTEHCRQQLVNGSQDNRANDDSGGPTAKVSANRRKPPNWSPQAKRSISSRISMSRTRNAGISIIPISIAPR